MTENEIMEKKCACGNRILKYVERPSPCGGYGINYYFDGGICSTCDKKNKATAREPLPEFTPEEADAHIPAW